MIQRPRGTRDFTPEEMTPRRALESRFRNVVNSFGFKEIATPIFENLELFVRKSGSDIVKQLYDFKDKGDRDICLRPELTAPVMRFYFTDLKMRPKPLKIFYFGNCFRYERPQDGRYREFWQFGVETIGGSNDLSNAELIDLASTCLTASGLKGFKIRVGHLGILKNVLKTIGLDEDQTSYVMPLIDKGDYAGLEDYLVSQKFDECDVSKLLNIVQYNVELDMFLDNWQGMSSVIGEIPEAQEALTDLKKIADHIRSWGTTGINIDLGIARGLDYYTGMVFEADLDDLGAEKQICGGGQYSLGEVFGMTDVKATGFAMGFDRVMLGLTRQEYALEEPYLDAFVIPLGEECLGSCMKIVKDLREAGMQVDMDQVGRGMGKNLKFAQNLNAKFAVFIGSDELAKKEAGVKNLETREQESVGFDGIVDYLKGNI